MSGLTKRSFDSPDETRTPPNAKVEVVKMDGATSARFTFQPGWRWSESVKPTAGTDTCQARHVGVIGQGRIHITHVDGSQGELGVGDAYVIEPGHDAWVVGDETVVMYEFQSAETFAK